MAGKVGYWTFKCQALPRIDFKKLKLLKLKLGDENLNFLVCTYTRFNSSGCGLYTQSTGKF